MSDTVIKHFIRSLQSINMEHCINSYSIQSTILCKLMSHVSFVQSVTSKPAKPETKTAYHHVSFCFPLISSEGFAVPKLC